MQKLRELRKRRGLTQVQLGDMANISQKAITAYERGVRQPKISSAARIAKALGVSVWEVFPLPDKHLPPAVRRLLIRMDQRPSRRRRMLSKVRKLADDA